MAFKRVSLFIVVAWLVLGCAPRSSTVLERTGDYRVEVRGHGQSDGLVDESTTQQLIHHVNITELELDSLAASSGDSPGLFAPGELEVVRGRGFEPLGIEVRKISARSRFQELFQFQPGDVVLSVGKRHATSVDHLGVIPDSLLKSGKAMITLRRKGLPHKYYYYMVHRLEAH